MPRLSPESQRTIVTLDAQKLRHIERDTYHSVHPDRPHLDPAQRGLATLVVLDATLTMPLSLSRMPWAAGFVMVEEGAGRELHGSCQVFKRMIAEERRRWRSFRSPLDRNRVSVHADPKHKCCLSLFAQLGLLQPPSSICILLDHVVLLLATRWPPPYQTICSILTWLSKLFQFDSIFGHPVLPSSIVSSLMPIDWYT